MFNHLKVPESWNSYFSKYPNGLTIMEALCDWVGQVDSMVDHINTVDEHINYLNKNLEEFYLTFQDNLSQEIMKTLQAWIEDGTLGEVIAQLIEGRMVFQNIQALQAAPNVFKLGTVVELLGYYAAGDGAGHKRIIASVDDGSGVSVGAKFANLIGYSASLSSLGCDVSKMGKFTCLDFDRDILINEPLEIKANTHFYSSTSSNSETGGILSSKTNIIKNSRNTVDIVSEDPTYPSILNAEALFYTTSKWHEGHYPQNFRLENINFAGDGFGSGFLSIYGGRYNLMNCTFSGFETSLDIRAGWSINLTEITAQDKARISEGTSISARQCHFNGGLELSGLLYSNFSSLTSDHCGGDVYNIDKCYANFENCGAESFTGDCFVIKDNSYVCFDLPVTIFGGNSSGKMFRIDGDSNDIVINQPATDKVFSIHLNGVNNTIKIYGHREPVITSTTSIGTNTIKWERLGVVKEWQIVNNTVFSREYSNIAGFEPPVITTEGFIGRTDLFQKKDLKLTIIDGIATYSGDYKIDVVGSGVGNIQINLDPKIVFEHTIIFPILWISGLEDPKAQVFGVVNAYDSTLNIYCRDSTTGSLVDMNQNKTLDGFEMKFNFSFNIANS